MIDLSYPSIGISLIKTDTKSYPKYQLPEGYSFAFYTDGDEEAWARLELELGQFKTLEEGIDVFNKQFLSSTVYDARERVVFVKDENGEIVATASLWYGGYLGRTRQRMHWVAVSDRCAGKGIAKAMLTRIMDLYNELGYEGFIYLWTSSRYYPAVAIYRKFGFIEYEGNIDPKTNLPSEDFENTNKKAISLLEAKIGKNPNK